MREVRLISIDDDYLQRIVAGDSPRDLLALWEEGITEEEARELAKYVEAHGEELGGVPEREKRLIAKLNGLFPEAPADDEL